MKRTKLDGTTDADSVHRFVKSRDQLLEEHPVLNKYTFETEAIRRFYAVVKFLIVAGFDSCSFGALPRSGKTFAIRMIIRYLATDFPRLPVYVFNVPRANNRYTKGFLDRWLRTVKHPERNGQIHLLRGRIVERLLTDALAMDSRKVVVLLDEAQNMGPHDLQFLKDIYNELLLNDVYLVTVSVGQQPELNETLDKLRLAGDSKKNGSYQDLIPRFFGNKRDFRHLEFPADVLAIFTTIDEQILAGSGGMTWTQFFAPKLWGRNWRLVGEVTTLGVVLKELGHLHPGSSRDGEDNMSFVAPGLLFGALRYFLVAMSDSDTSEAAEATEAAQAQTTRWQIWKDGLRYSEFEAGSGKRQREGTSWYVS
jgi:hypothetical protein